MSLDIFEDGTGEVSGCTWGLAVESPWLALDGPFLSSLAQMALESGLLVM